VDIGGPDIFPQQLRFSTMFHPIDFCHSDPPGRVRLRSRNVNVLMKETC
jgi:hypothetical protein